jgi:hypothetical protein
MVQGGDHGGRGGAAGELELLPHDDLGTQGDRKADTCIVKGTKTGNSSYNSEQVHPHPPQIRGGGGGAPWVYPCAGTEYS